jgi:hypothetical protein
MAEHLKIVNTTAIHNFRDQRCHLHVSCRSTMQPRTQCTKFHTAGGTWQFFTAFYFEVCIWPDVILKWVPQLV